MEKNNSNHICMVICYYLLPKKKDDANIVDDSLNTFISDQKDKQNDKYC